MLRPSAKQLNYIDTGILDHRGDVVLTAAQAAEIFGVSRKRFYGFPQSVLPAPVRPGRFYQTDLLWVREYLRWARLGVPDDEARRRANLSIGVGQSDPEPPNKNKKQQGSPTLRQRAQAWEGGAR